jgi:thiamine-phosphate pyrophosphorylase
VILCLVTDRERLGAAAFTFEQFRECLISQARFAVDAGIEIVQIRERDLEAAALAAIVSDLLQITRGTPTRLLVNDRLDIALACGADGVHLRSDAMSPTEARRIAPAGFLVGRSVHSVDEARAAVGADYLIAGTVFPSLSKPDSQPLIGIDGLKSIVRSATLPVLAIGGIAGGNIDDIARAGTAGCAAIGLFMSADRGRNGMACRAVPLRTLVDDARRRFDRVKTAPSR